MTKSTTTTAKATTPKRATITRSAIREKAITAASDVDLAAQAAAFPQEEAALDDGIEGVEFASATAEEPVPECDTETGETKAPVTVYDEGVTAGDVVLKGTAEQLEKVSSLQARLIESTFQFLATNDATIAAIAKHGPENLLKVVVAMAHTDIDSAIKPIKYIMRQLTADAHYRFASIQRQQMMAARAHNGGVNGFELSIQTIIDNASSYPGNDDDYCTPTEQVEAVHDLHAVLNGVYGTLQSIKFNWIEDFKPTELPFHWYMSADSKYVEIDNFEASVQFLSEKAALRAEEKQAKAAAALDSIANMSFV